MTESKAVSKSHHPKPSVAALFELQQHDTPRRLVLGTKPFLPVRKLQCILRRLYRSSIHLTASRCLHIMASAARTAAPSAVLVLRLVTLALLAASLAIIAADKITDNTDPESPPQKITFKDVYAYRYLLAVAVIGCAYTLLQIPFAAVSIARRKRVVGGSDDVALLLLFADVAAAGFGLTYDAKKFFDGFFDGVQTPAFQQLLRDVNRFFTLAFVSSGLMLAAAACVGLMVMVSAYSLVK
ncbi:hypothetical protein EJB05_27201, partial [Eragrostis curvula]